MTKIIIVDDHPIVREGLAAALGDDVVGAFGTADDAIREAKRLRPDVVVLDLELPGVNGVDAIAQFNAPVLVLTAYGTDEDVARALEAGAKGYLLKGAPLAEIEGAIDTVARGESVLDPRIRRRGDARRRLTNRERDVLRLVAGGNSNKEIAAKLRISERTAKFHVTSIFTKLGAENRAQAVAIAAEQHLI